MLLVFSTPSAIAGILTFIFLNMIRGNYIINHSKEKEVEDIEEEYQDKALNAIRFTFNNASNKRKSYKGKKYVKAPHRKGK